MNINIIDNIQIILLWPHYLCLVLPPLTQTSYKVWVTAFPYWINGNAFPNFLSLVLQNYKHYRNYFYKYFPE